MAKSRRAKKAAQFTLERVLSHLDNKHPGLPPELRQRFGGEIDVPLRISSTRS